VKKLLATFGDSWTFGSELENPQTECWTAQLSEYFSCVFNMGTPASSIGHIVVQLEKLLTQINLKDFDSCTFVFGLTSPSRYLMFDNLKNEYVNVTSEAVYYTNINNNGRPPDVAKHLLKFGNDFYRNVDHVKLQQYTVSQVVAFLQAWCKQNNIQDIYMSYFEDQTFNQFVNTDKIINCGNSLNLAPEYFTDGRSHPNKQGHAYIESLVKAAL
jgi:hypothetical protein